LEYYRKFAQENRLESVVTFLGVLSDEQLVEFYNKCDIFVLPSTSSAQEGFGLVALEAMACRKPVVVSEIIAVASDIRKEKAGIVVSPKDVAGLSQALLYLLTNENKRNEMGENAYLLVRNKYTWDRYADTIEREYFKNT
jgi:glycosyltransferase involved in cell wall biosynthesis